MIEHSDNWVFFGRDTREFMGKLEADTVSLEGERSSKYQKIFDSIFSEEGPDGENTGGLILWLEEFNADMYDINPDDGNPEIRIRDFYEAKTPISLNTFIVFFIHRLKNDPKIDEKQEHYQPNPKKSYESSNIRLFLSGSLDTMYVGLSGSPSDRRSILNLRPKWYFEYLICAMEYCIKFEDGLMSEEVHQKNLNLIQWSFRIDLDDSPSPNLVGYSAVPSDKRVCYEMVKNAGITSYDCVIWEQMFKVYIAIMKNFIDNEFMEIWPAAMVPYGADASRYRNLYDLFFESGKKFGFF